MPTDQARVYRAEVLVAELKPTFSPVDKASKDLRHNPVRQAADEQGAFVADSFGNHNDFRIARKFSDESFYLILIDGLYMFFPELRIVTIRLSKGTESSAAQDIAELGMKHATPQARIKTGHGSSQPKSTFRHSPINQQGSSSQSVRSRAATPEILLFLAFYTFATLICAGTCIAPN